MIFFLSVCAALSFFVGFSIPHFYNILKNKLLAQTEELKNEYRSGENKILVLIFVLVWPLVIFHNVSELHYLFLFLIFGLLAYSDLITRWLPDPLVYLLVSISVLDIDKKDIVTPFISSALYIMPLVMLNLITRLKIKKAIIASGDFYVLLPVGLAIFPTHSMLLMSLTILFAMVYSRFSKEVPLIFVSYMVMSGYELCVKYWV
ncbi:hypothetical protein ACP3S7_28155 [Phytobacter ursingii]